MSAELKPCPFCGGAPQLRHTYPSTCRVECTNCGVGGHWVSEADPHDHIPHAIAAWNRRAPAGEAQAVGHVTNTPGNWDALLQVELPTGTPLFAHPPERTQGMVRVPTSVLWDAVTALERSEHHVTGKQKSDAAMALRLASQSEGEKT